MISVTSKTFKIIWSTALPDNGQVCYHWWCYWYHQDLAPPPALAQVPWYHKRQKAEVFPHVQASRNSCEAVRKNWNWDLYIYNTLFILNVMYFFKVPLKLKLWFWCFHHVNVAFLSLWRTLLEKLQQYSSQINCHFKIWMVSLHSSKQRIKENNDMSHTE